MGSALISTLFMVYARSRVSLLAVAVSLMATLPLNSFALTSPDIFRQAQRQAVVLELLDSQGKVISANTALLIHNNQAVTLCHLLFGAASFRVVQGSEVFPAKLDKKDGSRNLCLLNVPGINFTAVNSILESDPAVGSKVYAISNALRMGLSISEGVIAGIRENKGEQYIQFTAAIAPGSEGGGLFDTEGKLIGLISYKQFDGQNVNFALPSRWLTQIEQRASGTDANDTFREQALALQREDKWPALVQHAAKWTQALTDNFEAWLFLGYAQERLKEWDSAALAYREGLKLTPSSTSASLSLAMILLQQNKPQEALDIARAQLAYRQEYAPTWLVIAQAENLLDHQDASKQALERAAQLDSRSQEAYRGLEALARKRKDWSAAVAAQRQLARLDTQNASVWTQLAQDYFIAKRYIRALSSSEHAIELAPDNGDAWFFKGLALTQLKRHLEAIDALKNCLKFNSTNKDWVWAALGDIYYSQKLFPEAVAAFREALKLNPTDTSHKGWLGTALQESFHFDEALTLAEELIVQTPKNPLAWRQIAYIYGDQNKSGMAIAAMEKSINLDPRQAGAWYYLVKLYRTVDRKDDTLRAYQKLMALDSTLAESAYRSYILPFQETP